MTSAGPALFGWRRGVAYALLLTLVMATLETVVPNLALDGVMVLRVAAEGLTGYALPAVLTVLAASIAVPRGSAGLLVLLALAITLLLTGLRFAWPTPFVSFNAWLGGFNYAQLGTIPLYLAWGTLLYSALFIGAHALAWRAERAQGRLAQAETERSRSETLFDEAQLASLQGAVDPAFVLRVLDVLRTRYAVDPIAADRLLDQFTGFLRLAMPAVRSGRSTLGAELALARSYLGLCATIGPQGALWQCEADAALDDVPFPPLLLLPLIDALAAQAPRASLVRARCEQANAVLTLHGRASPGWLPEPLLMRLRIGLRALHGPAALVVVAPAAQGDPSTALTLTFPRATPAPVPPPQPSGGASP